MSALQPPRINTQDTGTHDLSDDDHFSSASEGTANQAPSSPIPTTRVERVDDKLAYGEEPNTPAYQLRTADAVPDEVEVVPEGQRSRSATVSRGRAMSSLEQGSRPATPGGTPIPKTVVERVDDKPAFGEVPGTPAYDMRAEDAEPDEVIRAPATARSGVIDEGREDDQAVDDEGRQAWFRSMWEGEQEQATSELQDDGQAGDNDDDDDAFGDDFDEFAEGDGNDDFGDFDEAEEGEQETAAEPLRAAQPTPPDLLAGLPPLNLSALTRSQSQEAISPYLTFIFPTSASKPLTPLKDLPPLDPSTTSPFLSDRSLSLWQQLISPPPMQPPNWTRSRIRRLFLVSLGVPVDLDEILPPSKQKRLVLPNINLTSSSSPRPSTALSRLQDSGGLNDSSTSLDPKSGAPKPRSASSRRVAKGPPPPPDFDLNAAALVCSTTAEALQGLSDEELRRHVERLGVLVREASGVLEYWLLRKDEGVKEKEALEGVIENLVGFVKGRRGR